MKKCKGCGFLLQYDNPNAMGYALNINQDYCQRCFRLIHYNDVSQFNNEIIDNKSIINLYKEYKDEIFVLIVDAFDFLSLDNDDLLNYYKNNRLLIIVNKIDLLPKHVKDDKLLDLFKDVLNRCRNDNVIDCLLTYKDDYTFKDLFMNTIKQFDTNRFVFVGRVNAGKTTIINKLIGNNDLTVSTYPGTTLSSNAIDLDDYIFIDTPGIIDDNSFINILNKDLLKYLIPNKCVKPKIYQFYENQSYLIEGLIRFDVIAHNNSSIAFYIKNELSVHRCKLDNASKYQNTHMKDYKLNLLPFSVNEFNNIKDETFYLKGLGYIRVKGNLDVKIYVNKHILIYKCGVKF